MKFLDGVFDNKNIMPINIYYNRGTYEKNDDDFIDIIYKDMDTGKKHVQVIENPKVEIWITKPEYRDYEHIRNFVSKDMCYPIYVHYKTRYFEVARELGVPANEVKYSPYIFGFDHPIENFYWMHFLLEYGNTMTKRLSSGYLDIENDIIQVKGFPEPGEAPINIVTYIDAERKQSYTLILKADNIPNLDKDHPEYEYYNGLKENFWTQFTEFENNLDSFVNECHELFDDNFGVLDYHMLIFENEIDLIIALFDIIKASDNDYVSIWNSPYDMTNLIERPKVLGYDPSSIIVDERFGKREVLFVEDDNPNVHKRKHISNTYTMPTFICQMVNYAGIRSGRGRLPSVKLNFVARRELKEEKYDYSEEGGNIKTFAYRNFKKFVLYNIKDVLLQYGIGEKTKDIDNFYTTLYRNSVLPNQVFTSTSIISESLRKYLYTFKEGYVIGSNKSKIFGRDMKNDYSDIVKLIFSDEYDENYDPDDYFDENDEDDNDKFDGAFVMNPRHMSSTGFKLLGKLVQFIHNHVVDFDVTSEYPTAVIIMNASNETMVGKVYFENPEDINIEIYPEFNFIGDERDKYKIDHGNFLLETYSEGDVLNVGEIFLNLPPMESILTDFEKEFNL